MPDATRTPPQQIDLREIARQLSEAVNEMARSWNETARRLHEQHEAGALFALYRRMRATTDDAQSSELHAQWTAAIEGHDTAYLADLITFGLQLASTAQPVWDERRR